VSEPIRSAPHWDLFVLSTWLCVIGFICLSFVGVVKLVEWLT
jgi:hypothetical protein